jgi:hypothetical protein
MSSYIFISPKSDPGAGRPLVDPVIGRGVRRPTMGTCRPDLRRQVRPGDRIFVISGTIRGVSQYIIGGFDVSDKLSDQIEAYEQFPEHRLQCDEHGNKFGNIIVTANGEHDPRDHHGGFEQRIKNYLIGENQIVLETEREVKLGRERSPIILGDLFGRQDVQKVRDVVPRYRKLTDMQSDRLVEALQNLKREAQRG